MIVKRIKPSVTADALAGISLYATTLSQYIMRADPRDLNRLRMLELDETHNFPKNVGRYILAKSEEVLSYGSINLDPDDDDDDNAIADEDFLIEKFSRKIRKAGLTKCMEHWVISRRADEIGSDEDFLQTINLLLAGLGAEQCTVIWAVHKDTDHRHAHIAIAWLDSNTLEKISKHPWAIKAAHAALAVAHDKLGWQVEPNALYVVRGKEVQDRKTGEVIGDASDSQTWCSNAPLSSYDNVTTRQDKLDQHSLNEETASGLMSRKRVAIEIAKPIFDAAALRLQKLEPGLEKITALQQSLAREGIGLSRTRKGAFLIINGMNVKASINRRWSCAKIEKEFGAIPPSASSESAKIIEREIYEPDDPRRDYFRAKRSHADTVKSVKSGYTKPEMRAFIKRCSGSLSNAEKDCAFPTLEDWKEGGSELEDPRDVFARELRIVRFAADTITTNVPLAKYAYSGLKARTFSRRTEAFLPKTNIGARCPVMTDLGREIYISRRNDPDAVKLAIMLLALRNGKTIGGFNLSKEERKVAIETAKEMNVTLILDNGWRKLHYPTPSIASSKVDSGKTASEATTVAAPPHPNIDNVDNHDAGGAAVTNCSNDSTTRAMPPVAQSSQSAKTEAGFDNHETALNSPVVENAEIDKNRANTGKLIHEFRDFLDDPEVTIARTKTGFVCNNSGEHHSTYSAENLDNPYLPLLLEQYDRQGVAENQIDKILKRSALHSVDRNAIREAVLEKVSISDRHVAENYIGGYLWRQAFADYIDRKEVEEIREREHTIKLNATREQDMPPKPEQTGPSNGQNRLHNGKGVNGWSQDNDQGRSPFD